MGMLEDVGTYLAVQGVGTVGTDIFFDRMPDTPDACVALFEYDGLAPEFGHDSTTPSVEKPRLQVLVRNSSHATGRTNINTAYTALNGVSNETLTATRYLRIFPLQQPYYLRRDENERVEFACNFQVLKRAS